jgi:hypothetical protein
MKPLNTGRIAGLFYLLLAVSAPIRNIYIPKTLFASGIAAEQIAAHEGLFRLGIVCDLLSALFLIGLVSALYRLLKGVDAHLAVAMLILGGIMPATIYFVNVLNDVGALVLARGGDFSTAFARPERDALVALFIRLQHHGMLAGEVLWGVWLFPFAALAYRARLFPRVVCAWLVVNGLAYVAISAAGFLAPAHEAAIASWTMPALFGELAALLWLLIKGARPRSLDAVASSAANA